MTRVSSSSENVSLPKDYDEWRQQRQQVNKYFHIPQTTQNRIHILIKDTTLRSGETLVRLVHQAPDKTNPPNKKVVLSSPNNIIQRDAHESVSKAYSNVTPAEPNNVVDNTNQVDETRRVDFTLDTNQNSTAANSPGLTADTFVTTEKRLLNNIDQNETTRNNEPSVIHEAAANNQPTIVDNPEYIQTRLVVSQTQVKNQTNAVANKPNDQNVIAPVHGEATDFISTNNKDTESSSEQSNMVLKRPTLPVQVIQPNDNRNHSANQPVQPNVHHDRVTVNMQNLGTTNSLIIKSPNEINRSVVTDAPNQSLLFTIANQNVGQSEILGQNGLSQNQSVGQNNSGQSQNVVQIQIPVQNNLSLLKTDPLNQFLNKKQIMSVADTNTLKRKLPQSSSNNKPKSSKISTRRNSKDYDPNWLKKAFDNLDKDETQNFVNTVPEGDKTLPIIKNVTSLAHVSRCSTSNTEVHSARGVIQHSSTVARTKVHTVIEKSPKSNEAGDTAQAVSAINAVPAVNAETQIESGRNTSSVSSGPVELTPVTVHAGNCVVQNTMSS